jgi:hypothetical protein
LFFPFLGGRILSAVQPGFPLVPDYLVIHDAYGTE